MKLWHVTYYFSSPSEYDKRISLKGENLVTYFFSQTVRYLFTERLIIININDVIFLEGSLPN